MHSSLALSLSPPLYLSLSLSLSLSLYIYISLYISLSIYLSISLYIYVVELYYPNSAMSLYNVIIQMCKVGYCNTIHKPTTHYMTYYLVCTTCHHLPDIRNLLYTIYYVQLINYPLPTIYYPLYATF